MIRTWVGLFLSGHNKRVPSVSRGRSPGRKRREDVAWVLCWETAGSFFFGSALCDSIQTSFINRAYCWNQEGILNLREKRIQMHTCHQDVASRRVWVLVGAGVIPVGEAHGYILLGEELCSLLALVLINYSVGWNFPHFWWDWKGMPL